MSWALPPRPRTLKTAAAAAVLAGFEGMVGAVGEILDALADAGLSEETLVVLTTDHGIQFPRAKGTCYDASLEAGLVVRHPDVRPGVRDELLSNVGLPLILLD